MQHQTYIFAILIAVCGSTTVQCDGLFESFFKFILRPFKPDRTLLKQELNESLKKCESREDYVTQIIANTISVQFKATAITEYQNRYYNMPIWKRYYSPEGIELKRTLQTLRADCEDKHWGIKYIGKRMEQFNPLDPQMRLTKGVEQVDLQMECGPIE